MGPRDEHSMVWHAARVEARRCAPECVFDIQTAPSDPGRAGVALVAECQRERTESSLAGGGPRTSDRDRRCHGGGRRGIARDSSSPGTRRAHAQAGSRGCCRVGWIEPAAKARSGPRGPGGSDFGLVEAASARSALAPVRGIDSHSVDCRREVVPGCDELCEHRVVAHRIHREVAPVRGG